MVCAGKGFYWSIYRGFGYCDYVRLSDCLKLDGLSVFVCVVEFRRSCFEFRELFFVLVGKMLGILFCFK